MLLAVIIFGVLAAACLGTGGYLYYEYARSPQKAWRNRVLGQLKQARSTLMAEKARLKRLAEQQAAEEQAAHDQALSKLLRSISVDELAAYSGIGPGTVGKLRTYGVTDLARLRNMHVHIPGLGEKRLTDITTAANDLIRSSKQRFDNGSNPEGAGYRAALLQLQAKYERMTTQADQRARAASGVVEKLQRLAPLAERINCIRYHLVGGSALVPADVMNQPWPDLDSALRTANQPIPAAEAAL
ncbi:MAG TPA: hypothetical protein VFA18_21100, partial [Gemmataceae bacterium]|nr:hypothetical protein [Gemmataceae bacterium]